MPRVPTGIENDDDVEPGLAPGGTVGTVDTAPQYTERYTFGLSYAVKLAVAVGIWCIMAFYWSDLRFAVSLEQFLSRLVWWGLWGLPLLGLLYRLAQQLQEKLLLGPHGLKYHGCVFIYGYEAEVTWDEVVDIKMVEVTKTIFVRGVAVGENRWNEVGLLFGPQYTETCGSASCRKTWGAHVKLGNVNLEMSDEDFLVKLVAFKRASNPNWVPPSLASAVLTEAALVDTESVLTSTSATSAAGLTENLLAHAVAQEGSATSTAGLTEPLAAHAVAREGSVAIVDASVEVNDLEGQRQFVVCFAGGAVVRQDKALDSPKAGVLLTGTKITALAVETLPGGTVRVHCMKGWASIQAADGTPLLTEIGNAGSALVE